jgi:DNA modification methylase
MKKNKIDSKKMPGVHPKNKLNNLPGSNWQYWTKSVITKAYPINLQHKLRSEHGGQKPPQLCEDLIRVFTKEGQTVLDPLMGVGGTLIGASLSGRLAIGVEINKRWIDIYKQVCKLENLLEQRTIIGDSKLKLDQIEDNSIDFILTDVPYWNMDKLKKTRSKSARTSSLKIFNSEENESKQAWINEMYDILSKSIDKLKENCYMAVFIGDLYRDKNYHFLSAELALKLQGNNKVKMKSDIIWLDNSKALHIYGYPSAFIPSLIHQHVLIFRKEI